MPVALEHLGDNSKTDRNFTTIAGKLNPPLPQARLTRSTTQAVASSVATAVSFTTERWDSGGLHSNTTNTSLLTAPITGLYLIGGNVEFAISGAGTFREVFVLLNSVTRIDDVLIAPIPNINRLSITTAWQLTKGEYVELVVGQDSGGSLNINSAEFWMVRLGGFVNEGI